MSNGLTEKEMREVFERIEATWKEIEEKLQIGVVVSEDGEMRVVSYEKGCEIVIDPVTGCRHTIGEPDVEYVKLGEEK